MFFNGTYSGYDMRFSKRKAKIRDRALEEYEVVEAVCKRVDERISDLKIITSQLESSLKTIEETYVSKRLSGAGEKEINRIILDMENIKEERSRTEAIIDDLYNVRTLVRKLSLVVRCMLRYERYSYVIKLIPEKRLPNMVDSENQIALVGELVNNSLRRLNLKIQKDQVLLHAIERESKRIDEAFGMVQARYNDHSEERKRDEIDKELSKKYGFTLNERVNERVKPVSAITTDANVSENHNNA